MERVRLSVRKGFTASKASPVSIFVGSERMQFRAERVLLWSIENVRDPARVYDVHLMRDLVGFRRMGWRTGFTNYRFAVPALAGGIGRAIYNDVDQIYRRDPGELFDLDFDAHALLALEVGPRFDSAVMLLDCAQMLKVWSFDEARTRSKRQLLRNARREEKGIGPLPEAWHRRDVDWDGRAPANLVHYTTLHTQPWRPAPEHYEYRENRHAALWHELESDADAAGFRIATLESLSQSIEI